MVLNGESMDDIGRFMQFAYAGRAVLLCGQDLEPNTSRRLSEALSKRLGIDEYSSLLDLCAKVKDPSLLIKLIESISSSNFAQQPFPKIASVPWGTVITSALDDDLSESLSETDRQ